MMRLLRARYITLKREKCPFSRTKKVKLHYKVAAKVPFRRLQLVSPRVQFTLQKFVFLTSSLPIFPTPPPHNFSNALSQIRHTFEEQKPNFSAKIIGLIDYSNMGKTVSVHEKKNITKFTL